MMRRVAHSLLQVISARLRVMGAENGTLEDCVCSVCVHQVCV
jgi:hypothetical protein